MEYLNFYILLILIVIGLVFIKEDLIELAVLSLVVGVFLMSIHTGVFFGQRSSYFDMMYQLEEYHRNEDDLTPKYKDSLNNVIHNLKYENKHYWFNGQYIPDEVDTLTFFKK